MPEPCLPHRDTAAGTDPGATKLKLQADHFPLQVSLLARIVSVYGDGDAAVDSDLAMDAEEMVGYLRNVPQNCPSPLDDMLRQADAIGDPAMPSSEQIAILRWLEAAFGEWQEHFPLEEPLATELRRLHPLLAAFAANDPLFLAPGAHPLHHLLDAIQERAVGWQARLGRVGEALRQNVGEQVQAVLAWFESPGLDLATVSADRLQRLAKAADRSATITQRLVEAERGRSRVAESQSRAARMINEQLQRYPAPQEIAGFLTGPWYTSAQVLLVRFGSKSEQWRDMTEATALLLDSLQDPPEEDPAREQRRRYLLELLATLPEQIARCLLSMQHDSAAVEDALLQIEGLHRQILLGKPLSKVRMQPLALDDVGEGSTPQTGDNYLDLQEGQWFLLEREGEHILRAQLVLRLEYERLLLFVNQAGMKVMRIGFDEFARMVASKQATVLDVGASFSRSLARAARVTTLDDLDQLTGVAAERESLQRIRRERAEQDQQRLSELTSTCEAAAAAHRRRQLQVIEGFERGWQQVRKQWREREEARLRRQEELLVNEQQLEDERDVARRQQAKWEEVVVVHRERYTRARAVEPDVQPRERELDLPEGTWLAFRDSKREETILARLAVYNPARNDYIFVDRHGATVRQFLGHHLQEILGREMIDILHARSRFRDEVARLQQYPAAGSSAGRSAP